MHENMIGAGDGLRVMSSATNNACSLTVTRENVVRIMIGALLRTVKITVCATMFSE